MSRRYERKTDRRSREERRYSVRAEHREQPDTELLAELLIRFALQDAGEARAAIADPRNGALAGSRPRA
jgi:hypothetical protein